MEGGATFAVEGGEKVLTNKEKRLARKAEKQAQRAAEQIDGNVDEKKRKATEQAEQPAEVSLVESKSGAEAEGDDAGEGEEDEEEAISHKERRKRRKLEKQAGRHQQTDEGEEHYSERTGYGEVLAKRKETIQRSPYSLWVGNLSFHTSPQRLQEWFEQHDVTGITRVHMPKGARKMEYNRGFAYVDVPSADAMQDGIALSEVNLDGRRLLIKAGSDFAGRPSIDAAAKALAEGRITSEDVDEEHAGGATQTSTRKGKTGLTKTAQKILRAQRHPPGPTLFFGNLSFSATEESLRDMIERAAASRFESETLKAESEEKRKRKEKKNAGEAKGSEEEGTEKGDEKPDKDEAQPGNHVLRGAGIRKVRMGEFEDSGKCKGFAFIDFHSAAYATATLIDPRNSHLDGRELQVQYAGPEAIRRGAPKGKGVPRTEGYDRAPRFRREARPEERKDLAESAPVPGTFDPEEPLVKRHKETREERAKRREGDNRHRRVKPGAALAQAQRGKIAIATDAPVGQKKTFDD